MSISRKTPNSNGGRENALTTAKTKKDSSPPGGNLLSAATSTRLDDDQASYTTAMDGVTAAEEAQRTLSIAIEPKRGKLRDMITGYFTTVNTGIKINIIPLSSHAFFSLDIGNNRLPDISTDELLLLWGQRIIDGDAARVSAGGVAMAFPSIAQFTAVFTPTKVAINSFSNTKTALTIAQQAVTDLNPQIDATILRVWNEIEAALSDFTKTAKRAAAREWGIKYVSTGLNGEISGIVTHTDGSVAGGIELHLQGVSHKFYSDLITGAYTIRTNLNGDLVIIAKGFGLVENDTDIFLEDGGNITQNIVMVSV